MSADRTQDLSEGLKKGHPRRRDRVHCGGARCKRRHATQVVCKGDADACRLAHTRRLEERSLGGPPGKWARHRGKEAHFTYAAGGPTYEQKNHNQDDTRVRANTSCKIKFARDIFKKLRVAVWPDVRFLQGLILLVARGRRACFP